MGQPYGHDVARQLQPAAQTLRSIVFLAVVLRTPAFTVAATRETDRGVQHDGGRGIVVLQRRRIDEGLEGRARLTLGLCGPVEAGQGVGVAADHGQHPARLRLNRHQGTVDVGHLFQKVLAAPRLYEDQVAAPQLAIGVGPGCIGRNQRARTVVAGGADADIVAGHRLDGRGLPGPAFGWTLPPHGGLAPALGEVGRAPGPAPAVPAVIVLQPAHQGVARRRLQRRVQRGPHIVAAAVDLFLAEAGDGLTPRLLDEEVGVGVLGPARRVLCRQRAGEGRGQLGVVDEAVLVHLAQHPVAAAQGGLGVAFGVVVVRPLGQGRQEGRLVRRQLAQRLAEIVIGRRGHAIRAIAEENLVEIQLHDLLFGQRRFQPVGQNGFLDLAVDTALIGQQDVLGHLLGDGRAALQPSPGGGVEDVLEHGPAQTAHVDAAVVEEIAVLGRQEGLDHRQRDLLIRHIDAPLVREFADQRPVAGIDPRRRRRPVVGQFRGVGQVMEQPGRIDGHDQPGQGDPAQQGHARHHEPAFGNLHLILRRTGPMGWFSPRRRPRLEP